jgi:hypothetical protein
LPWVTFIIADIVTVTREGVSGDFRGGIGAALGGARRGQIDTSQSRTGHQSGFARSGIGARVNNRRGSLSRPLLFGVRFGFRFKRFEFFPGEAIWEPPVGVTGDIGETLILVAAEGSFY